MNRAAHLRIAAIQQGPNEADPRRNVDALLRSIDEAAAGGADVVVATELSTCPGAPRTTICMPVSRWTSFTKPITS